jgi:hypothetical protein
MAITDASQPEIDQLEWTEQELLATHPIEEPLIAGGVRCHGGFDADGAYVSPRTQNRMPAVKAWQANHEATFGTELLGAPIDTWPGHYPNLAQSQYLVEHGVTGPTISELTRIGTVEGFGGLIRHSLIPDLQACFDEDVRGTACAHLDKGLYEAHARDEAGHEDEGGHKQMWFAARDVAFEDPATEDETVLMLERMGIAEPGAGGQIDVEAMRAKALANRILPHDVPFELEALIERMVRLLFIEISAFHSFAWAEDLLADPDLVAGDGDGGRLISYVRADETPHVEYLRTVLSEMRDRTFVGLDGQKHPGTEMIGTIWDRALHESLFLRRTEFLDMTLRETEHALEGRADAADLLEGFHALGTMHPGPDGSWVDVDLDDEVDA